MGDRLKQALFAILEPELRGRAILDLYAGSGAAGIEALSRGAARAVLVDREPAAIRSIEANLESTGLAATAVVVRSDAQTWLARDASGFGPFAAVVADPPYERSDLLLEALEVIAAAGPDGILAADGVVVAKHFGKTTVAAEIGLLRSVRERHFGETTLTFLRWAEDR